MSAPRTYLTPWQFQHMRLMPELIARGVSINDACKSLNLYESAVRQLLRRVLGNSVWPPVIPASLLDLPIMDTQRHRGNSECKQVDPGAPDNADLVRRSFGLTEEQIIERRESVAAKRRQHVKDMLEAERIKYDLPRAGRPLSDMPI